MDFSESLSMFTDSLLHNPLIDFNAEDLFSNLLSEGESNKSLEDLSSEETSLFCEEEISNEDVVSEQTEPIQVLSKRTKTKLKRGQVNKVCDINKKAMKLRASSKSHQEVVDMISLVYQALPKTSTLHASFVKVTKIQKLDQIHKFVLSVQQNGYTANK